MAPDQLDSVLSMPAEPVPEDLGEEPVEYSPLSVTAVTAGPMAEDPEIEERSTAPDAGRAVTPPPPPPPPSAPESSAASAAPSGGTPLPRRTPIDATAVRWGPREHPPAVSAPPPPHPLDAPPVARVKRPSATGSGLPAGMASAGPASVPSGPSSTVAAATVADTPLSVPERPSHPRVRRWFGRGSGGADGGADAGGTTADAEPASAEPEAASGPEPFPGAPAGLLDGVVPEPDGGAGVEDPGGLEAAMARLSAGARRSALAPLAVVSVLLEDGEVAEAVVQGELHHRPAVAVLTDRRLVVANDRRWAPDVRTFELDSRLTVHGWQDDRRATLVFVVDGVGVVLDAIADRPLARDLAQRIRSRCGGAPAPSETT